MITSCKYNLGLLKSTLKLVTGFVDSLIIVDLIRTVLVTHTITASFTWHNHSFVQSFSTLYFTEIMNMSVYLLHEITKGIWASSFARVPWMEPRASHIQGKCFLVELSCYPSLELLSLLLNFYVCITIVWYRAWLITPKNKKSILNFTGVIVLLFLWLYKYKMNIFSWNICLFWCQALNPGPHKTKISSFLTKLHLWPKTIFKLLNGMLVHLGREY